MKIRRVYELTNMKEWYHIRGSLELLKSIEIIILYIAVSHDHYGSVGSPSFNIYPSPLISNRKT
jgi:hypothetical protein